MKLATVIAIPAAVFALGAEAITVAQCRAACRGGPAAMRRFCRIIPLLPVRAGCWAAAAALGTQGGQTACANWCYWQFSRNRRRAVLDVLERRDEVSLESDFKLTGINLDADV
jgi:hypothetical protein